MKTKEVLDSVKEVLMSKPAVRIAIRVIGASALASGLACIIIKNKTKIAPDMLEEISEPSEETLLVIEETKEE